MVLIVVAQVLMADVENVKIKESQPGRCRERETRRVRRLWRASKDARRKWRKAGSGYKDKGLLSFPLQVTGSHSTAIVIDFYSMLYGKSRVCNIKF